MKTSRKVHICLHWFLYPPHQCRSQPKNCGVSKNLGGTKMFDCRRITLCFLEKYLSKHKMTVFFENLGRWHGPFAPSQLRLLLQLTASPWTTEASTSERWKLGTLTDRKATSSNRAPSVALLLYRDKRITIIRLWWLSQWLVTHGHHLAVIIYLHVAPTSGHHTMLLIMYCYAKQCQFATNYL